jgi:hypothetical protein
VKEGQTKQEKQGKGGKKGGKGGKEKKKGIEAKGRTETRKGASKEKKRKKEKIKKNKRKKENIIFLLSSGMRHALLFRIPRRLQQGAALRGSGKAGSSRHSCERLDRFVIPDHGVIAREAVESCPQLVRLQHRVANATVLATGT